MTKRNSLLALRDRESQEAPKAKPEPVATKAAPSTVAPSRQGKKAITGYFHPDMSFAMHTTARRHNMSLQGAMAEAFDDWLRKMGESPIGE
jgi:hypothetical protein